MAFTDPIATSATPFTVKGTAHSLAPASYFTWSTSKLRPTNAWWQNLIIPHYDSSNYNGKTMSLPYAQWPQTDGKGITISYFGNQPGDRSVANNSITLSGAKDISLGINETISTREITDYSDLGVSLRFNHSGGNMVSHLVQGQAFHNGIFTTATPVITIEGAILEINGVSPGSANLSGVTKLKVKTNRYDRVWVIYASSAISFTLSGNSLIATSTYTGRVQLAVLNQASDEAVYDANSSATLTGGSVNATYSGNTATMTFNYTTTGSGSPLIFALPHHQDLMPGATYTSLTLNTLRGDMRALVGSIWTLSETLTSISWTAPNPIPAGKYSDIQTALNTEKNSLYDTVGNGWGVSPYYYGKYLAKMAQLILIAEQIGDTTTATTIATNIKNQITSYLTATPTGSAGVNGSGYRNALLYQGGTTWKGISTENGLADMGADFGSGRFNDHHFHYGYWIYAAAVVARNDATWRANNKAAIESLIRDIANPSHSDTYFPKFRHKDWYAGHSWAGGLVGIDVGPGQESTSEAINAWYGIYLWGLATSNTDLRDTGRLLLASEIRSAKKYWHIAANSDIYPSPFNNHGTAVIIRTHKVAVETYFGSRPEYFYGIQSLPFTPITEEYMDSAWVTRSYPMASVNIPIASTGNPQDTGWNSLMYGMHAVIDPSAGYSEALSMPLTQITNTADTQYGPDIDNGHTKANALYWASTRTASGGGGGGGSTSTNASAVPYLALTSGQANTSARTTVVNANYTLTANDSLIAYTSLSAARTVTLPSASSVTPGKQFIIKDESGNCSSGNTITISGTIDGTSNYILNTAYARTIVYSSGNAWYRLNV